MYTGYLDILTDFKANASNILELSDFTYCPCFIGYLVIVAWILIIHLRISK
jgi:hypothetical protein